MPTPDQVSAFNDTKDEVLKNLKELLFTQENQTFIINKIKKTSLEIPSGFFDNFNDYIRITISAIQKWSNGQVQSHEFLKSLNARVNQFYHVKVLLLSEITNTNKLMESFAYLSTSSMMLYTELNQFEVISESFRELSFNAISESLAEVQTELSSFRRLRNIADTALTEQIYENATKKFRNQANMYKGLFIGMLLLIAYIAITFKFPNELTPSFWIPKITISLVGITLVTYFLKQSSHYQKLADQNYQTQVELQAYPSFMESIPTDEAAVIRKELALKYFGREIDGSAHKNMSNLISDQMKSTTELVKATTESIKNLKG